MRLTDNQARMAQQQVESFLRGDGRRFDLGNPQHFDQLAAHVRSTVSDVADEDNLLTVTAICLLGPAFADIPPAAMREELLEILRWFVPDESGRLTRVMEFAIAYGCGKWRTVQEGYGGWEQPWEGAVRGLARALEPAVNESNRWLSDRMVGFPKDRNAEADAFFLAMRLMRPLHPLHITREETMTIACADDGTDIVAQDYQDTVPPGAKAVWTVAAGEAALTLPDAQSLALPAGAKIILTARDEETRIAAQTGDVIKREPLPVGAVAQLQPTNEMTLTIWECACGNRHCAERHSLRAWNPTSVSLWAFVASAVKGPQPNVQTGSFAQGMYFPLLAKEGIDGARLRLASVEYKICPACGEPYEGGQCPRDKTTFDETTDRKTTSDRLILVGEYPAIYVPAARFRCTNKECGNLYVALQCPLCRAPKPQRPTTVWVRTFAKPESLEELQQRDLAGDEKDNDTEEANDNAEDRED